jgi:hypothetical protein
MNRIYLAAVGVTVIALAGCGKEATSTAPPKPGQTEPRKLTLTVPKEEGVTQAGTHEFEISVDRGGFAGDIEIAIADLPAGVSKVTDLMTIPAGKDSLKVTVKAEPAAKPVEDHLVKVTARAKDQKDIPEVSQTFKLDVKAKN